MLLCPTGQESFAKKLFFLSVHFYQAFSTIQVVYQKREDKPEILTEESFEFTLVKPHVFTEVLSSFRTDKKIQLEAKSHGLTKSLFKKVFSSFTKKLARNDFSVLSMKVNHVVHGISSKLYNLDALLPLFIEHGCIVYPSLKQFSDLRTISDISEPTLWYENARSIKRKIIYHAGPTNSGKTHAALQRFYEAESGVYCSPLRLLAREVCQKARDHGVHCDMITGDDRDYHYHENDQASKVACTVEMTNLFRRYEIAIIDEIQMLSDMERGWAWTRAFLGVCAPEIHVCGEARAVDIVRQLADECNDSFEVVTYKRLGKLRVKKHPVESFNNLKPGDCIICFNKSRIYSYQKKLNSLGINSAIIYGSLPPRTKLEQAKKFNDKDHPCNVLITTDAIGMGLNLNIRRIIFSDLYKTTLTKGGRREVKQLTTSHALQIAGRAGRFNSQYKDGEVTSLSSKHMPLLHKLLRQKAPEIKVAGLHPSFELLAQFANVLNTKSLSEVIVMFIGMCEMNEKLFFLCSLTECHDIAEYLEDSNACRGISLRDMYTFCSSPISSGNKEVLSVLAAFVNSYANNVAVTEEDVKSLLRWPPPRQAKSKTEIEHLESLHEVLRLYMWLSYRFKDIFPDMFAIKTMRRHVDRLIQNSVSNKSNIYNSAHAKVEPIIDFTVD
ncbi:ATP-dependent RNA helicase SUPV3L1, mitochondrial [Ciona intestinalis]